MTGRGENELQEVIKGYISGFYMEDIKGEIESFIPSVAQTPGRLNLFRFKEFNVLLDFDHNPAGLRALKSLVEKMKGTPKVGMIAGIGDRRAEDNQEIGAVAAETFD